MLGRYEGALRTAVHLLKYARRGELAPSLGRALAAALPQALPPDAGAGDPGAVVPVPLHPRRLAERGFNQSALLAREVARATGAPLLAGALLRPRDGPPQVSLDGAARRAGVRGAFEVRRGGHGAAVSGRGCLLVDDVVTTGATAAACARALLDAGAQRVRLLALARA